VAIVRELLIKIGFVSDKKAINATNQAITGFKTRFALAATAATYAISKITGFFTDIATATLDSKDLADALGLSVKELTQLSEGLKGFRLDDSQVRGTLLKVNQLFYDFRIGANNQLAEIARGFNFEIDRNAGPVAVFRQILEGLRDYENATERIAKAKEIFGDVIGPRIAEAAANLDTLNAAVVSFAEKGQLVQDSIPALDDYIKAVNSLTQAWQNLVQSLGRTVFPALEQLINYLTIASNFYRNLFTGNVEGLKNTLKEGSSFVQPAFDFVGSGYNKVKDFLGGYITAFDNYASGRIEEQPFSMTPQMAGISPTITNNIDIQVPFGTTEDQARYMSDQVQEAVNDMIWDTFIQIQNNNPTVE
jgi:hypothetical protein